MTKKKSAPALVLSACRDIPFDKLLLAQSNVRRIKAGVSIESLAEDIAYRTLLQSLTVRPQLDAEGAETGLFEIPAGGRRYRALALLVKQKRLPKTAPVPCVVRTDGLAEEDSLAENTQREALHPLDQFRAFAALRDKGLGDEEIAARFFVTATIVRQRLKLASASPRLLDLYAEDALTLEQLMAFCVVDDHARQDEVWNALQQDYNREPYQIRRMLTEGAVRSDDRRAVFVGAEAYEAARGIILRDLFQQDRGGWWQDAALLDRLTHAKLDEVAAAARAEGWAWAETAIQLPYGQMAGHSRVWGEQPALTEGQAARLIALRAEIDAIEEAHAEAEEVPDSVHARLDQLEEERDAIEHRAELFDPADMARAGIFVSLDGDGRIHVARGYVRPDAAGQGGPEAGGAGRTPTAARGSSNADARDPDAPRPLPDRLVQDLGAFRTIALRERLGATPDVALQALLHSLCLDQMYHAGVGQVAVRGNGTALSARGLAETQPFLAIEARRAALRATLPQRSDALWEALGAMDSAARLDLLAHCVAENLDAASRGAAGMTGTLQLLAHAVGYDAAAAGWTATVANYLGQVTKAEILAAVRQAKGAAAAVRLVTLKKGAMAEAAEALLADTGWVPRVLRRVPSDDAETEGASVSASEPPGFEEEEDGAAYAMAAE